MGRRKGKTEAARKKKSACFGITCTATSKTKICIWPEKGLSTTSARAIKELKPKDELPVVLLEEYRARQSGVAEAVPDSRRQLRHRPQGERAQVGADDRRSARRRRPTIKSFGATKMTKAREKKPRRHLQIARLAPRPPQHHHSSTHARRPLDLRGHFSRDRRETNRDALEHYDAQLKVVQFGGAWLGRRRGYALGSRGEPNRATKSAAALVADDPVAGPTSPGALSIRPKRDAHFSSLRNAGAPPAAAPVGVAAPSGNQAATATSLKDWRYVDEKSRPLMAKDLEAGTLFEYRLLPFKLVVMVDQRKLSDLMKALAESPLPLEVRGAGQRA